MVAQMTVAPELEATRPQRVLVVDDDELVQVGIRAVLSQQPWVAQCFGASSLESAMAAVRARHPQIVIVEMAVQGTSGLQICRAISTSFPHIRVLLMSREGRLSRNVARAHGGQGFISKSIGAAGVAEAVRLIAQGRNVFPREEVDDSDRLSRRELDVLEQMVLGFSNPEVAEVLHLSRHTVKQHTCAVYRKLKVRNRAEAAAKARELGLVS